MKTNTKTNIFYKLKKISERKHGLYSKNHVKSYCTHCVPSHSILYGGAGVELHKEENISKCS